MRKVLLFSVTYVTLGLLPLTLGAAKVGDNRVSDSISVSASLIPDPWEASLIPDPWE